MPLHWVITVGSVKLWGNLSYFLAWFSKDSVFGYVDDGAGS